MYADKIREDKLDEYKEYLRRMGPDDLHAIADEPERFNAKALLPEDISDTIKDMKKALDECPTIDGGIDDLDHAREIIRGLYNVIDEALTVLEV